MANALSSMFVTLGLNTAGWEDGLTKATRRMQMFGKDVQGTFQSAANSIGVMGASFGAFGPMGMVVSQALSRIGQASGYAIKEFSGMSPMFGVFAGATAGLAAGAGTAAVALAGLAVEGAEIVHRFDLISQKTGVSVKDLQMFEAAGKTVGVSLESVQMAFRRFDKAITSVGTGSGAAKRILQELGVTSHDNKEAFLQLADAFEKMPNGPKKMADAMALMGRPGMNLIPLLNKGRQGVEEFMGIVEHFGPTVGKSAMEAHDKWEIATLSMSLAMDRFKVSMVEVLPILTKMVTGVAELARSFGDMVTHAGNKPGSAIGEFFKGGFQRMWEGEKEDFAGKGIGGKAWAGVMAFSPLKQAGRFMGGGLGGVSTASDREAEARMRANELPKTDIARLKAEEDAISAAEKLYEIEKAGGAAGYALAEAQKKISADVAEGTEGSLREAAALERGLDAMRLKAQVEKEHRPFEVGKRVEATEKEFTKLEIAAQAHLSLKHAAGESTAAMMINDAEQKAATTITDKLASAVDSVGGEIKQQADVIRAHAESFKALAVASAVAENIDKFAEATVRATEQSNDQINSLEALASAYAAGSAAIDEARVQEKLKGDRVALASLAEEYLAVVAAQGELSNNAIALSAKLTAAQDAVNRHQESLRRTVFAEKQEKAGAAASSFGTSDLEDRIAAIKIWRSAHLDSDTAVTNADLALFKLEDELSKRRSDNEFTRLNREKLVRAAAFTLELDNAKRLFDLQRSEADEREKMFNEALRQSKQKFEDANQALFMEGRTYDQRQAMAKQWDDEAIKIGTFHEKATAVLNSVRMEGENMWGSIAEASRTAISGVSDSLAKMVVTGKGDFKNLAQSFEESIAKAVFQKGMSSLTGGIMNMLGMGGAPGEKRDGSSETRALWVQMAGGLGSLGTGGASAGGFNPFSILGSPGGGEEGGGLFGSLGGIFGGGGGGFLSSIGSMFGGFLEGGGDVTPGKAYIVGESGPEIFRAGAGGTVLPSKAIGGSTINQQFVINTPNADSFQRSQRQISAQMYRDAAAAHSRIRT